MSLESVMGMNKHMRFMKIREPFWSCIANQIKVSSGSSKKMKEQAEVMDQLLQMKRKEHQTSK